MGVPRNFKHKLRGGSKGCYSSIERIRPPKKYPVVQTEGNVVVTDSLNNVISVVECGTRFPVNNSLIVNSGSTFSISVPATSGYTLPNVIHINSDGEEVILPSVVPMVCTELISFFGLTDNTTAPIYYIGWTDDGTTYYISRITVALDGTSVSASATGAWTDRYTLIYT